METENKKQRFELSAIRENIIVKSHPIYIRGTLGGEKIALAGSESQILKVAEVISSDVDYIKGGELVVYDSRLLQEMGMNTMKLDYLSDGCFAIPVGTIVCRLIDNEGNDPEAMPDYMPTKP